MGSRISPAKKAMDNSNTVAGTRLTVITLQQFLQRPFIARGLHERVEESDERQGSTPERSRSEGEREISLRLASQPTITRLRLLSAACARKGAWLAARVT